MNQEETKSCHESRNNYWNIFAPSRLKQLLKKICLVCIWHLVRAILHLKNLIFLDLIRLWNENDNKSILIAVELFCLSDHHWVDVDSSFTVQSTIKDKPNKSFLDKISGSWNFTYHIKKFVMIRSQCSFHCLYLPFVLFGEVLSYYSTGFGNIVSNIVGTFLGILWYK